MDSRKIQWSAGAPLDPTKVRSNLPYRAEEFRLGEHRFPSTYIVPRVRYVNTTTPPFSTKECPYTCEGTDMLKLDHLHNPMILFGQPFTGKTCLFMKLTVQAMKYYGDRHWVRMLNLRIAAQNCTKTGSWPTDIFDLLSDELNMCPTTLRNLFEPLPNTKQLIRKCRFNKLIRGDLFLDGFDEIPLVEREYFLKLLPQLKQMRQDCPIRVWISCRSYFKPRLLNLLGDESSFEIMDYGADLQKKKLFSGWKDRLFPKKIKNYEETRLWEYTNIMYNEFCKELPDFATTIGTSPLYLEVIASIFTNHATSFFTLFRKLREDQLAGPSGLGVHGGQEHAGEAEIAPDPSQDTGKKKKNKKRVTEQRPNSPSPPEAVENNAPQDCVPAPTSQILCQIAGMFLTEVFEYLAFTIIDIYCLKYHCNRKLNDKEYQRLFEREYKRTTHLICEYAIKTFSSKYRYETLVPSGEDPDYLIPNLSLIVDEELHHTGALVMGKKDGLVELRHKMLGDFFLAKHYASRLNCKINVRDSQFERFYLRVLLFDEAAWNIRSFYDNILHFSVPDYSPLLLKKFLLKQYKLAPEDSAEWQRICNNGSVFHLMILEGFHRTALTIVQCFDPTHEREHIRKLLMIKTPLDVHKGTRPGATYYKISGNYHAGRHLVSSLSLMAMFVHSVAIEELLEIMLLFYSFEEIRDEFADAGNWTPMHYAAMHSNLWFIAYMYNDVLVPAKILPPPGIYNPLGQLPMHVLISYSWHHIMKMVDHFLPEYDSFDFCSLPDCQNYCCCAHQMGDGVLNSDQTTRETRHTHCREIASFRQMVKDTLGPGNMLRVSQLECIRLMLTYSGEDINAPEKFTGNTLLHLATIDGCLDTVKFLLDKGAIAQSKNYEGKTPMHFAGMHGHRKIFICLAKRGAEATCKDNDGQTPIAMWSRYGRRIDKAKNEPKSRAEKHFFKACKDIERIIQRETRSPQEGEAEENPAGSSAENENDKEKKKKKHKKKKKRYVSQYEQAIAELMDNLWKRKTEKVCIEEEDEENSESDTENSDEENQAEKHSEKEDKVGDQEGT